MQRISSPASNGTVYKGGSEYACGPTGCGMLSDACLQPSAASADVNWRYVGGGNGGYEKMNSLRHASEGTGDIGMSVQSTSPCLAESKFCAGFLVMMLLMAGAYLGVAGLAGTAGPKVLTASVSSDRSTMTSPPQRDLVVLLPADEVHVEGRVAQAVHLVHPQEFTFDCVDKTTTWDTARRGWCCNKFGVQCQKDQAVPTARQPHMQQTAALSTQLPWHSGQPASLAPESEWTPPVLDYESTKVPGIRKTVSTSESPQPAYDCQVGLSQWKKDWSLAKMAWCCYQDGLGCPPSPKKEKGDVHLAEQAIASDQNTSTVQVNTSSSLTPISSFSAVDGVADNISSPNAQDVSSERGSRAQGEAAVLVVQDTPQVEIVPTTSRAIQGRHSTSLQQVSVAAEVTAVSSTRTWTSTMTPTKLLHGQDTAKTTATETYDLSAPITATSQDDAQSATMQSTTADAPAGVGIELSSARGSGLTEARLEPLVEVTATPSTSTSPVSLPKLPNKSGSALKRNPSSASVSLDSTFDCKVGVTRWEKGWSVLKRAWCCKHQHIACGTYDCNEDFDTWRFSWPIAKKDWCCQKQKRGCAAHPDVNIQEDPFACHIGLERWQDDWSQAKKSWCCRNKQLGCPPAVIKSYDCSEGLATWSSEWSAPKKTWCCENEGFGCSSISREASSVPSTYNCSAGRSQWHTVWSESKQRWCCHHKGIACE